MIGKQNTTFKGDLIRLVSGTGLVTSIALIALPILTRMYGPEAFGQAAMFATITGVLAVTACMGYEYAIVSPKSDKQAVNLLVINIVICSLYVCGIVAPLIFFHGETLLIWVKMEEVEKVLWLIPVTTWFSGVFMALKYWSTRTKHFSRLSLAQVIAAGTGTAGSLSFGFNGYVSGTHMIVSQIVGQAVATIILFKQLLQDNGRFILNSLSWRVSKLMLLRYRNFPIYYNSSKIISTLSASLPIILFGVYFSSAAVGFYILALRIINGPTSLLYASVAQVFHQRSAEAKNNGTLPKLTNETVLIVIGTGVFPLLLVSLYSPEIFSAIFGIEWRRAGVLSQIIVLYTVVHIVYVPISMLDAVLDLQKFEFLLNLTALALSSLGLILGGLNDDIILAIWLFTVSNIVICLLKIHLLLKHSGADQKLIASQFFKQIAFFSPAFVSYVWILSFNNGVQLNLLILCFLFCAWVGYTFLTFGSKNEIIKLLKNPRVK